MRRYRELLPPDVQDAATLGEGETPLLHCERYGRRIGIERLFLKDESQNPSGSFKDRLAFAAIAMAPRFGARAVGVSSTGNAGAAAAAYAARAGLPCIVLTVQGAASAIVTQMQAYGAMVVATRTKADRWKLLQTGVAEWGWYPTSPYFGPPVGSNPYGVDGYKTLAYEVCEQMDWEPPDWCVLPVAYGDALFGMWKGFDELARLGLIRKQPRMVAAEMAGCLAAALASGEDAIPEIAAPSPYVAGSISVNQSTYQALHALRASGGTARVARNDELLGLQRDLGRGRRHLRRALLPGRPCRGGTPVRRRAHRPERHGGGRQHRQRPQGHRRHRRGRTGGPHRGRRHHPIPGDPARCLRLSCRHVTAGTPNPSFPRNRLCQNSAWVRNGADAPYRHSRESLPSTPIGGGNPGVLEGRYSGVSPLHPSWIPAFQGVSKCPLSLWERVGVREPRGKQAGVNGNEWER